MEEIFGEGLFWLICNFIGGTIRWIYGLIWRTLFNKQKYKYKEFLFGIDKSKNHFDIHGHQFNNMIITIVFLVFLFYFIL